MSVLRGTGRTPLGSTGRVWRDIFLTGRRALCRATVDVARRLWYSREPSLS